MRCPGLGGGCPYRELDGQDVGLNEQGTWADEIFRPLLCQLS